MAEGRRLHDAAGSHGQTSDYAVVELIASQPGSADRLLAEHIDDGKGHCKGCTGGVRPTWPCTIQYHATRAREVERRRDPDLDHAQGRQRGR